MSNQMSNAPMMQGGSTPFFQTWVNALTKPNEQTFADMAASPNAKATTAYLWVFIGSIVQFFLTALVQGAVFRRAFEQSGFGGSSGFSGGLGGTLVTVICGAPILAVITTLFFAIGVFIVQWIAKMFGGKGTSGQLAYALAAITAPYSMIAGVFILLSVIPYVGFCFNLILAVAGIYVIVLEVMAVKGVNQFGWGAALGSLFIPGLVIGFICACLVAVLVAALGPAIGNVFSTINQSLVP